MANPESKKLAIDVIARVDKLEREMGKARKATSDNFTKMESRGKQFESRMAGIGKAAFAGFAAGAVAALAPMAAFNRAMATLAEGSSLAKAADRVGLTTTAFQELSFGMSLAGVEAAAFETNMEQFTKRVGEAATRGGNLAKIFQANGVALRDSNGQIRSSESLLRDYADLIKNAASAQERMTLATEAFGRGGGDMVTALQNGAAGLDDMKRATEEAGGTIDEELLRRAEELDDRFAAMWRTFDVNSKSAILSAITYLDQFQSKLSQIGNSGMFRWLSERAGTSGAVFVPGQGVFNPSTDAMTPDARIASAFSGAVQEADAELIKALRQRYGVAADKASTTVLPGGREGSTGGPRSRNAAADAALREAEAVLGIIDSLRAERQQIGMTDSERAKANALRMAGAAATTEQAAEIMELIDAIYAERDALESASAAMEEMRDIGRDVMGSFIRDMVEGKNAVESLANALSNIGSRLLNSGLDALFGGLFGGGGVNYGSLSASGRYLFDKGGYTGPGGKYQPAGIVHKGEVVWSQRDVANAGGVAAVEAMRRGMAGYANGGPVSMPAMPTLRPARSAGGGGGYTDQRVFNIDARGAQQGVGREIQEALRLYDREVLPGRVNQIARDPRVRG